MFEATAENACARLKTELGARFATRFKSDVGCRTQIAQASESFASVALGTCLKAADKASCIQAQVTAGTATLQDVLGSGPTPAELAEGHVRARRSFPAAAHSHLICPAPSSSLVPTLPIWALNVLLTMQIRKTGLTVLPMTRPL